MKILIPLIILATIYLGIMAYMVGIAFQMILAL